MDREGRQELFAERLSIRSQISDAVVPDVPLTIGPGYEPNPAAAGHEG